jgi:acyl-coenzyme A thioesterase PaaI-like protein
VNSPRQPQANSRCFVCGAENARGLQLTFIAGADGSAEAAWETDSEWESFSGVIHGGIISTVLDEAMSKAVTLSGPAGLTCELRIRLRQHLVPGERVTVKGWVVDRRKRRIRTEATLRDESGVERAHAWATFLTPA